jgi:hypothetical protein
MSKNVLKRIVSYMVIDYIGNLKLSLYLTGTKQQMGRGTLVLPAKRNHFRALNVASHSCVVLT